ncbi:MAG: M4 family metallopeptidase [Chitinophagales bacterium]|nr:M4 family metallopeptidase [Chitinophagaceae bacterium]MCB9065562.1 M4 family metallopeptidase [Chitinophagales bacterium]
MKKLLPLVLTVLMQLNVMAQAGSASVTRNPMDNTVKTIVFGSANGPEIDKADALLAEYTELDRNHSWKLKFTNEPEEGVVVKRYMQWYMGIPVEHGCMSFMAKDGKVGFMNGNIYKPSKALSTTPTMTEAHALQTAMSYIGADEYMWEGANAPKGYKGDDFNKPTGVLVWVEDYNLENADRQLHLAYRFDIYAKEPMSRDYVYVDANTGKILLKDAIMKHVGATGTAVYSGNVSFETSLLSPNNYSLEDVTRDVYTYDLNNSTNFGSAVDFTNSSTTWAKAYSIDAHWGTTQVYEYWKTIHNRLSYDGSGGYLISFLNYSNNYNNAFWNGNYMVYGNGTGMFNSGFEPLMALDVCAHEIGHGVCQHTSGLIYQKESGAMNEGFSDIWGAVIENYAAPNKQMWSMGEELRTGALRSMSNPKLYKDPDTYDGTHWVTVTGCTPGSGNDQCGVHTNSGVLNHWFYLLTEGGIGVNDNNDAFEVNGLGTVKAAKIAYGAEQMLSPNATFSNCRTASINVATTLYGSCSREVEAVMRAWYAVGVGSAFSPCNPQIGFAIKDTVIERDIVTTICPAVKSVKIPLRVTGGAPTGGNAVLTFSGAGTAKGGADYNIPSNSLTFNSGSTAGQDIQIAILDNGDTSKEKVLKLYFTIAQNGSNASTSYTYDTCVIKIVSEKSSPDTAGNIARMINRADVRSKAITPFFSRNKMARTQFIITAEEMKAAGIEPNVPISAIDFNVTEKNSTQAFTGFTLKINSTAQKDLSGGNPTVSTQFYSNDYTTQLGWNRIPLALTLVWNGTDNLAFETCFSNSTAGSDNDYIEGFGTINPVTAVKFANSGTACSLPYNTGFTSISKPVIRMVQAVSATEVETIVVSSKEWPVHPGQDVYFHNDTNSKLIANISNANLELGCVKAFILSQGVGMVPMGQPFTMANKAVKEFNLTIPQNAALSTYDMTMFFDTSELSGVSITSPYILATNTTIDSTMDTTNSVVVPATMIQSQNHMGFKGSFKGVYLRYALLDRAITIPEPESVSILGKNGGSIRVDNNPFTDRIYISYHLLKDTKASIRLYDITGKVLYNSERELQASGSRFRIDLNGNAIVPGSYILQVVTANEIMTERVVKQ